MTADSVEFLFEKFWCGFQKNQITKGDLVSLYLLTCDRLFPTPHWLSWSSSRQHVSQELLSTFYPKLDPDWSQHPFFKRVPLDHSLGRIMNQSLFKKETLRASRGLIHIYIDPDSVLILDYIPSPIELLEMQSRGQRCVTLLKEKKWFHFEFDHRRNLRDFVIHDLEHLWQMFENPVLTKAQIQFSKQLLALTHFGHFDFIQRHTVFAKEFDYIISDMNTHPAHTYATLKSLVERTQNAIATESGRHNGILVEEIMRPLDGLISE